ncbi:MAG: hypothetical protein ABIP54_04580, partial [Candidatus Andersenbacteria bacterium]
IYWIITNTLCILMGHPQMAVYILILEAVFVICILLLDWRTWLRALTVLCGVFLIVGLTLPYTLPILDVFPSTERANGISADKNGLFEFEFTAQALKGLILSHPFGHGSQYKGAKNESELSSYLGPVAIILAFIGLFIGRKKFPILWLFSVLISSVGGLLAFGGYSPVYRWLIDVGLRYFNAPARFFLFTDIGLVFLASIGLYFVTTWIRDSHSRFVLTKLLIFTIVAPVVWVSWFWYEGVPWQYTKEPAIAKVLAQQNTFTRVFSKEKLSDIAPNNNFGITLWDSVCSTCLYRQSFNSPFNIMNGIKIKFSSPKAMGVITIKLFDDSGKQLKKVSLSSNEVNDSDWTIFAFSDLEGVLGKSFYFELTSDMSKAQAPRVFIHTNPKNEQYDPTGALSLCQKNSCTPVLADFNTIDIDFEVTTTHSNAVVGYELLTPYIPVGFGIGTAQWAGSLEITDVDKYLAHLGDRSSDSVWEENRSLVNRFPITHVIGLYPPYRYGTNLHDFKEIASVPLDNMFIRLYQNNQAFSRIHFVQHVQAIQGSRNQQKELLKLNPQDQETVVASVANNINFISGGSAKITEDQRTTIAIQTENPSDGFLVLRDVVLPGWIVRIDGKEIPSILTDSLFRGIKVPAGSHKVTFQYSPRWLKIALIGELLSLTLLVVLIYCTIFHKQFKVIKRNL